ncbi:MAG: pilus assembly protein PilM [Candidatus Aceula meridiana]|nr:pilus assembly protein PilM [Candidatus Aceula meridiana]
MKKHLTTIIEITETHVKFLEAALSRRKPVLLRSSVAKITEPSEQGISKLLTTMADPRMKKTYVVAVVPRRQVMVRYFSFPSHSEEEIKKMISLQVVQQVPYAREDIVFDYTILDKDSSGYAKVLAAIAHKEVISRYFKVFAKAGLTINSIVLSSIAVVNWLSSYEKKEKTSHGVSILNIDTSTSEICFCKKGRLLFSRHIGFGVKDLGADQEDAFVREVGMTLESYQKEKIGPLPQKIILLAPPEAIVGFSQKIQSELQLNAEFIDPYQYFIEAKEIAIPIISKGDYYSLVVPSGLAVKGGQKNFNLLPKVVSDQRKAKAKKSAWIKFLLLASLIILFGSGILLTKVQQEKNRFDNIKEKLAELKPRIEEIKRKKEHIEAIEKYLNVKPLSVDIIYELYNLTPKDASFRLIYVDPQDNVTLQGIAEKLSSVNGFQSRLVNSSLFTNVNLQYATQRKIFQGEITDFKITAEIVRP